MNTGGVMDNYDILFYMTLFYLMLMFFICGVYLRTMYIQYKNAHDKWYGINID